MDSNVKIFHLPTSKIGSLSEFHESILGLLKSTTVTLISGHFSAMTLHVGPPTYPAPIQQIALIEFISWRSEWITYASKVKRRRFTLGVYSHFRFTKFVVSGNQRGIPLLDADWLVLIEDRRDLETNKERVERESE